MLVSCKMTSMLALFTFSSCCDFNDDLEETLAQEADLEQSLEIIKAQNRLRQQTAEAKPRTVREEAAGLAQQELTQLREEAAGQDRELRRLQAHAAGLAQELERLRGVAQALLRLEDVDESWRLPISPQAELEEEKRFTETLNGDGCHICMSYSSFFLYGTCRCPRCPLQMCKKCYWTIIAGADPRCPTCRIPMNGM